MLSLIVNPIHVCETRVQCRNRTGQAFHSVTLWSFFFLTLDVLSNRFILWWNWKKSSSLPLMQNDIFLACTFWAKCCSNYIDWKTEYNFSYLYHWYKKIISTNFTLISFIRNIRSFWYNCELVIQHVNFMRCLSYD